MYLVAATVKWRQILPSVNSRRVTAAATFMVPMHPRKRNEALPSPVRLRLVNNPAGNVNKSSPNRNPAVTRTR